MEQKRDRTIMRMRAVLVTGYMGWEDRPFPPLSFNETGSLFAMKGFVFSVP
jgi:hypothetical protein